MFKSFKSALLLVLLNANVLSAATYYVSKTGNDSNNGSQGAPWLTVSKAASTASAGDTVNLAAGTYNENVAFNNSGGASSPITFLGANGVVIAGNITLSGNYITLSGITCSPPSAGGFCAVAMNGNYDTLTNSPVANYGAVASDQATMVNLNGNYDTVINCVYANMNDIDVFHIWGNNQLISGCVVTNVNEVNYAENHTDFVQTWGSSTYNVLIKDCLVINSTCQVGNTEMDINSGTFGWIFENCIFRNISNCFFSGIPNTEFYNCVFDNVGANQGEVIYFYSEGDSGNQRSSANDAVINCVIINSPWGMGVDNINNTTSFPAMSLSQIPQVDNYSGSSPGFVNEAAANYHLTSSSPLIGAGTNLSSIFTTDLTGNSRPASGAWDIGAYEYASGGASNGTPAAISVSPGSISYGTVLSGTSVTNSITVKNVGGGTLSGTGSVSAPFILVGSGSYSLASNQSQTVTVAFSPTTAGSYSQNVTLTGGGGASVGLTGSATNAPVPAAISVSPGSISYGTVLSGTSVTNSITVKNVGGGTLSGTGSVSAPFILVGSGSYSLASNQSQTVTVAFSPTTAGSYSQNVTLTGGGGASVGLTGSATNAPVPAAISVSPGSISYGTVLSGTSVTNSITVKNVGGGTLSGTGSVSAPFILVGSGSYSLASNQSQTVTVAFSPTTAGSYSQNVTLTGGGGASVGLTGSATNAPVPAAISVSPGSISYGTVLSGTSVTNSITVKNVGGGTLSGTGSVSAPFILVGSGSYSLASNQSQTVTVAFSPTTAGSYSQNVTLTGGGGASVGLTGSATNAPVPAAISVSPGSISYGTVLSGTSVTNSITVKNVGGGTLSGTGSVSAPFILVGSGSYSLASNQSQTVTVAFSPTTAGSYSQNVTLTGGGGASVGLTGSATNIPPNLTTVSAIRVYATAVDSNAPGLQVYPGTTVQLSATASNALTWQWSYTVNGGSPVVYTNSTSPITNISYYYDTTAASNSYEWTLVVSNGQSWAESQTNLAVENIIQGPNVAATSGALSALLTSSTTINGVPTSYVYQPLPSIGNTSGGTATYNVTITNAGDYEIQALVYAPNVNANSFLVNIDSQPQNPTMIWDIMPVTTGFEQRIVSWRGTAGSENNDSIVPVVFSLTAGPHQIVFVGREPGTAMASFTLLQVVTTVQQSSSPAAPNGLRVISSAP